MPSASDGGARRVLIALLVYNGEELVRPCLASLAGLQTSPHQVDVLVLDDASPAPGWSERCAELVDSLGFDYYRTPRNLGIPRNMNLALLRAMDLDYDAVILLNSDTIVPEDMVRVLVAPLGNDETISSVTAWSNSASIYSLATERPSVLGEAPDLVTWISRTMEAEFAHEVMPIPSAVGFCMAIPTSAIRAVGLMDPVFGRGYSEEIDWCLRSHAAGYRSVLAPSCFVYHAGSGVNVVEGLIGGTNNRAVLGHQAIIDARYPMYRAQIEAYWASRIPGELRGRGPRALVVSAARELGYRLDVGRLPLGPGDDHLVRFSLEPDGTNLSASYLGFRWTCPIGHGGVQATVEALVGWPPTTVQVHSRGARAAELLAGLDWRRDGLLQHPAYPEHVL